MNRGRPLQRRTPLQARTPLAPGGGGLQRRTPVNPVSQRRRTENAERRVMVRDLFPERPYCTVWMARLHAGLPPLPRCTRWADDVHEPLTRGRGGSITDPDNATAPCRPCHHVLTVTPDSQLGWAYQLGLLRHSWDAGTVAHG